MDRARRRRLGAKSNLYAHTQKSSNRLIRFRCSNSCFLLETGIAGHKRLLLAKWHPKAKKKLRRRPFFDRTDRHEKLYGRSQLYASAQGRHETSSVFSLFSSSFDISMKNSVQRWSSDFSRPVSCKNQEDGAGKPWSLHAPLKGEVRTINDRKICERRSCMKNNGKSPTFKFVSGEERRPLEVQRVSRGWRLPGATHSSADLTWIRKWLEIQAPELSELESVELELGSCCSDLDKQVSDEICRTRKRQFEIPFRL